MLAKDRSPQCRASLKTTRKRFGEQADAVLKAYSPANDAEAVESAAALGERHVHRLRHLEVDRDARAAPAALAGLSLLVRSEDPGRARHEGQRRRGHPRDIGARHAGEIEYVFGALDSMQNVTWEASDRKLSDAMTTYWSNFARSGDPNGSNLPKWPRYPGDGGRVLHLDETIHDAPDANRSRYQAIDAFVEKQRR